jgi:uncharacterized protein YjiS (DUF1127 family)
MTTSAIETRDTRPLLHLVQEQASRLMRWVAGRRMVARTQRELAGLSEVELKDIGITRCAIDDVARGAAGRCGAVCGSSACPVVSRNAVR